MAKGNWCYKAKRFCQEGDCSDCELYYRQLPTDYNDDCCIEELR